MERIRLSEIGLRSFRLSTPARELPDQCPNSFGRNHRRLIRDNKESQGFKASSLSNFSRVGMKL
jgi:hypothetical protein